MLTKIAAFVLAGSIAALSVVRVADIARSVRHHEWGHKADVEVPANVTGTYIFDENGDALGKFPWQAHAELELREHGRFELRVRTNIGDEMEEETSWGRYKLKGDQLILRSADDEDTHSLRIDGNKLEFDPSWKARIALKAVGVSKTYMEKQQQ